MLVRNEYLPCLRQMTPQSMPVTKKDLLDLASIDPDDPGNWDMWAHVLTTKWLNYYMSVTFFASAQIALKQLIMIWFADPSASFECTNLAD